MALSHIMAYMNNLAIAEIVGKFGSQVRLASEIDVSQSTIAHWIKRGVIPSRQQWKILGAARRLKIDLSPNDFFPEEIAGEVSQ